MVYVAERYLPGRGREELLPGLARLQSALEEVPSEGSNVRYLGSTIVLGDEARFSQFEGPSEAAVAEITARPDCRSTGSPDSTRSTHSQEQ
jgi:hypothetical protein